MRPIVEKSLVAGLLSMLASLAISFSIVPLLGGQVAGAGLLMSILCPLAISIRASALHFTQSEKVRRAEAATKDALNKLVDAYEALRIQARINGLTGVLTRSAFIEDLYMTSQRGGTGALLFLDLEHFKSINDRYVGACYCGRGVDPSDRLEAADENLYQAKALARNRAIV